MEVSSATNIPCSEQHLSFLLASIDVVQSCAPPHDPLIHSRLVRAVLPFLANLLSTQSEVSREVDNNTSGTKSKKGKKRARGYEGDEVFNVDRLIICPTQRDGEVVLAALECKSVTKREHYSDTNLRYSAEGDFTTRHSVSSHTVHHD